MEDLSLYEKMKIEQKEIDHLISNIIHDKYQLISVSPYYEFSRVYRSNSKVYKIRKIVPSNARKLADEYKILEKINKSNSSYFPDLHYEVVGEYEVLVKNFKEGYSFERYLELRRLRIKHLISLFIEVIKLNLICVSYRDFSSENVFINSKEQVFLLDFDQAIIMNPIKAVLNDVFAIGSKKFKAIHPYRRLVQRFLYYKIPLISKIAAIKRPKSNRIQIVPNELDHYDPINNRAKILQNAWHIAEKSNANSPGANKAYYSLKIDGLNLRGERPWEVRWGNLQKKVDFRKLRILELGCNLGLFSTFMKLNGADSCTGLDIDEDIVKAALLVSQAFGINNEYYVCNFDTFVCWEEKYLNYDMVLALSVAHWVKDKDRFYQFLRRFNRLLYEGHDEIDIELNRLRSMEFDHIEIIDMSERGRALFYAWKDQAIS